MHMHRKDIEEKKNGFGLNSNYLGSFIEPHRPNHAANCICQCIVKLTSDNFARITYILYKSCEKRKSLSIQRNKKNIVQANKRNQFNYLFKLNFPQNTKLSDAYANFVIGCHDTHPEDVLALATSEHFGIAYLSELADCREVLYITTLEQRMEQLSRKCLSKSDYIKQLIQYYGLMFKWKQMLFISKVNVVWARTEQTKCVSTRPMLKWTLHGFHPIWNLSTQFQMKLLEFRF